MSVKMSAYDWLTANDPAAAAWRKEVTMHEWNNVYGRAQSDNEHGGGWFKKQVDRIERPATGRDVKHGTYFTIPTQESK